MNEKLVDYIVLGGLHKDDFVRISREFEGEGYVLIAFLLEDDFYHWKAVFVKDEGGAVSVLMGDGKREVVKRDGRRESLEEPGGPVGEGSIQ